MLKKLTPLISTAVCFSLLLFLSAPVSAQEGQQDPVQNMFRQFNQNQQQDQPADQPADQTADQPADQPMDQSTDQPATDQPAVAEPGMDEPGTGETGMSEPGGDMSTDPYAEPGYVDPMGVFLEEKAAIDAVADPAAQGETLRQLLELFLQRAQEDAGDVLISHGPITLDGPMGRLAITDLVMENTTEKETVFIKSMSLENYAYVDGSLTKARFMVTGLSFDSPDDSFNEAAMTLRELGYEDVALDITLDYASDVATKTFMLNELTLGSPFVADLSLSFTLGNLDLTNPEQLSENPFAITIHNANLTYLDHSLMPKVFEMGAADEQMTVEQFKQEGIQELDMELATAQQANDQGTILVLEALKSFIMNPQKLTMTMAPPQPVPVAMFLGLQDFSQAVQQLSLSLTAN